MAGSAALYLSLKKLRAGVVPSDSSLSETAVSKLVKVKIGTGGHGHCYPGATVPFGMV